MADLVQVEDADAVFQPSSPSRSAPASTTNRDEIATLFGLNAESMVTVDGGSLWVVFQSCFGSGSFAKIYDSNRDQLLGILKAPCRAQETFSLQALCKVHKPAGTCKCWVTFSKDTQRTPIFFDLLKWLGRSGVDKQHHCDLSIEIRKSHGMKVRRSS